MPMLTRPLLLALALLALLVACSSKPQRAPVEVRSPAPSRPAAAVPASAPVLAASAAQPSAPAADAKPLPGAENAGKPGYYTVKPGDTLIRIGLDNGQNWRDVRRWNQIEDPNKIEVGQVLRVVPPGIDASAVTANAVGTSRVEARALDAKPAASAPAALPASAPAPQAHEGEDIINWQWPAAGMLAGTFEEGKSKGIVITGTAGDPVVAAADGRVVYAGSGLRGYGNLVIIKHNADFLSAYAHNQTLLVKEDQAVLRGQKIAEMGATDADRVQLHFEVRRQGKPVDPLKLLPPR